MDIVIFIVLFLISVGYFSYEVYWRYQYTRLGKPEGRNNNRCKRFIIFCENVLLQKKIRKYPLLGLFHGFIMWGFVVSLFSTIDMAGLGLIQTGVPFVSSNSQYLFLRDTFMVLVMIGVIGFTIRRMFFKPDWLHNSFMAYAILLLIFVIVFSELFYFSTQAILEGTNFHGNSWLVLGFSKLININQNYTIRLLGELSWWVHFLTIFLFFYLIPRTKHLHLAFAPLNIYWSSLQPKGSIQPVNLGEEMEQAFGVKTLEDFSWKQLFDSFSCVQCGRCHGFCPSERSGERLKPKKISGRLRTQMEFDGPKLLKTFSGRISTIKDNIKDQDPSRNKMVGGMFHHDFIWSCTTCGGCNEVCPVSIDNLSKLIDMRRNIVAEKKDIPLEMKQVFRGIVKCGNPLGKERGQNNELTWIKDLGIPTFTQNAKAEYLFYLGCQATFDKTSQKAIIAFARILQRAGVDFAVLGEKEWCCGETARRMGNEPLFQTVVNKNNDHWAELGIKKIITTCPHCFNTLKNEYPQFGGNYEVIPHSVFLAELQHKGKLKFTQKYNLKITYHDPCYLGRYNNIYNQPRQILSTIPGVNLVEMSRIKEESFCCGAGGGRFWTRQNEDNAISTNRVNQALDTGAEMIITSCPYCNKIFKEKLEGQEKKKNIISLDIAEFLES